MANGATASKTAKMATATTSTPTMKPNVKSAWTFHRWLVVMGAVVSLLSPLLISPGAYGFLGPMLAPSLIALVLIAVWGKAWTHLTAAIVGSIFPLLGIVVMGVFEQGLTNPLVGATTRFAFANILALAFVLVGGITGFRYARANRPLPTLGAGWRTRSGQFAVVMIAAVLAAGLTATLASSHATQSSFGNAWDFTPAAAVNMPMRGFTFDPNEITLQRGVQTEIVMTNEDPAAHTFTYAHAGTTYDHHVLPGQTVKVLVNFLEAGTIKFWCTPHSSGADSEGDEMFGTITVA